MDTFTYMYGLEPPANPIAWRLQDSLDEEHRPWWAPCEDQELIFETPSRDLVYPEAGFRGNQATAELRAALDKLYPAAEPLLTRILIIHNTAGRYGDMRHVPHSAHVLPENVASFMFRGEDEDIPNACRLAKRLGSVRLASRPELQFDELAEFDCEYREHKKESKQYYPRGRDKVFDYAEIVYDPERIARRRRALLAAESRKHVSNGRSRFLTVDELAVFPREMYRQLHRTLSRYRSAVSLTAYGRDFVIGASLDILIDFTRVFGRNSHRQLKSFWELMALWKKHGQATRKAFGSKVEYFNWLDRELRAKNPKPRDLEKSTEHRLKDLPGYYKPPEEKVTEE